MAISRLVESILLRFLCKENEEIQEGEMGRERGTHGTGGEESIRGFSGKTELANYSLMKLVP
jgi:hypothetical protein